MKCKFCGAYVIKSNKCPICGKALIDVDINDRLRTPSDLDVPVLVMAPPIIQNIYAENNPFMEELEKDIGKTPQEAFNPDLLMRQWLDIYRILSMDALILTLPPNPLFQDLTWVNQFVYLPHVEEPTCVLSNFAAEGRDPESDLAEDFLAEMGYITYRIPNPEWTFEGEPDCKWLRENIYLAGFGARTKEESLDWIANKFDAEIIKLGRTDERNYHFDEVACVLTPTKVMVVTPFCDKNELKRLEKYTEIITIEDETLGEFCITNNIVIGYTIYAGTYIELFDPDHEFYEIEIRKIEMLEDISAKYGFDLVVFDVSQFYVFGAALSCVAARLNYYDRLHMDEWESYGGK